jgi:hypothetical protein
MLLYFILVVALFGWAGHLAWQWRKARAFAPELLAARQESGELPPGVKAEEFTDLYVRAEGPRASTYFFACAALLTFGLGPLAAVFNGIWNTIWRFVGQPPVFEAGTLIHTFSFFLAMMGVTIAVLAIAMRRYYALMPPTLKQIIRELSKSER